jgi:hypothetical protein
MPRRVSKKDLATLIPLVEKYSTSQILSAAEKLALGVRKAGHPDESDPGNPISIWACIEYRRRNNGTGKIGTKKVAAQSLAADLRDHMANRHLAPGSLLRMYSEAKEPFSADPQLKEFAEQIVKGMEQGQIPTLPTLWTKTAEGLKTAVFRNPGHLRLTVVRSTGDGLIISFMEPP